MTIAPSESALLGPLLQSFFTEHLLSHRRASLQTVLTRIAAKSAQVKTVALIGISSDTLSPMILTPPLGPEMW